MLSLRFEDGQRLATLSLPATTNFNLPSRRKQKLSAAIVLDIHPAGLFACWDTELHTIRYQLMSAVREARKNSPKR